MTPQEAEIAAENYWKSRGAVSTRRPVRTKWQKQDYLGADVLAVMPDGSKTWTQVTTSQLPNHVRERRRKLEAVPWAESDSVYVFEVEERPGVVSKRRTDRFFRVHQLMHNIWDGAWDVWVDPIAIPGAWLKASWVPPTSESPAAEPGALMLCEADGLWEPIALVREHEEWADDAAEDDIRRAHQEDKRRECEWAEEDREEDGVEAKP